MFTEHTVCVMSLSPVPYPTSKVPMWGADGDLTFSAVVMPTLVCRSTLAPARRSSSTIPAYSSWLAE